MRRLLHHPIFVFFLNRVSDDDQNNVEGESHVKKPSPLLELKFGIGNIIIINIRRRRKR